MAFTPADEKSIQKYIRYIREMINDKPEMNRLIRGEESSDSQIRLALLHAISRMITEDPIPNYGISNCPYPHLLLDYALYILLRNAGIWNSRNALQYSAGGLTVQLYGKGGEYMQWMNQLERSVKSELRDAYATRNVRAAYGYFPAGMVSDYIEGAMSLLEDSDGWTINCAP